MQTTIQLNHFRRSGIATAVKDRDTFQRFGNIAWKMCQECCLL